MRQAHAPTLTVLGIETSCDETAAAVVRLGERGRADILSDIILGQADAHAPYRGVVPEIAARAHVEALDHVIATAMDAAGLGFTQLDAVAATAGPGLIGGVMVGLTAGKAIALAHDIPLMAINHLEGHALSPQLSAETPYPYLLLLASGGHCQFIAVEGLGAYVRLGSTIDDAAGEAFDKGAKLLGLGFPGGPAVEALAAQGDARRFALPRPLVGRAGCDLSFAGLKTALARQAEGLADADRADLCASYQGAIVACILDRAARAMDMFEATPRDGLRFAAAGGVAANKALRAELETLAQSRGYGFTVPPLRRCTDNAAMIAFAGAERLRAGFSGDLMARARPRWPLDEAAASLRPTHEAGRKGVKA